MKIEECRWTQFPNDFIDQGGVRVVGATSACIYWCITRKTKGWQKTSDDVSYSQLIEMTGFARDTISKAIKTLEKNGLIEAVKRTGKTTTYKLKLSDTSPEIGLVPSSNPTSASPVTGHTKETIKENSKDNSTGGNDKKPSDYTRVMKAYFEGFKDAVGEKPLINNVVGSQIKNLLKSQSADNIVLCLGAYFTKAFWFTREKQYDIKQFVLHYNEVLSRAKLIEGGGNREKTSTRAQIEKKFADQDSKHYDSKTNKVVRRENG